jgi:CRP/FNR family transcriptional regulator, cyclic AMP receptor protein
MHTSTEDTRLACEGVLRCTRVSCDPLASVGLEAIRGSFLTHLPTEMLEQVVSDTIRLDVPAGAVVYRAGEAARTALVLSGLIRVYLASREGRQVTVRYVRRGDVIGAPVAVGGPVGVSVQALTESSLLILNVGTCPADR